MVVNAVDRFLDRYAYTMLEAIKKEGPIKAAFRTSHLPVAVRADIRSRVVALKRMS